MSKKCTLFFWREAHFQVKMYKAHQVRTTLEVEMSKKCTPFWPEAHFEVNMCKAHHVRTTFGSWDVEKVHTVVARSTFPSQNVQSTPGSWDVEKVDAVVARSTFPSQNVQNTQLRSEHFLKLTCRKIARRWGRKRISKPKNVKNTTCSDRFWKFRCGFPWQAQGILHLAKSEQNVRALRHFQKLWWQAWDIWRGPGKMHFRGMRSTKDMFIRDVRRSGRWFLERGCILEHQVFRFAKMILHDRCSTSYDLALLLLQAQHFTQMERKNRKTHWYEAVSSALNFPFLKEVSQNCYDFDVVKFENWGRLAELLRFQACR